MSNLGMTLAKMEAGEISKDVEAVADNAVEIGRIQGAYQQGGIENVAAELGVTESYYKNLTEYETKGDLT